MNLKPWLIAPIALLSSTGLLAQATEPMTTDDETVVLSPFQVNGTDDVGYQATSTLGGTRIRTQLKDIGSSISIINEEFLRDTGSANLEDVLIFTPNTEVGGLGGNYSAAQANGAPVPESQRDSQGGGVTRIRGLAQADLTRDYFISSTPFDTFNTERVEVQRGANSALFGLGSPGGIVNASTIKADFLRNRGQFKAETDSYGTQRFSMRYNQILNKYVAFRVAALNDDTGYEQKQAWSKDKRYFVAATAKLPFNLTARGSFETAERRSARPDYFPVNDGITPWIEMGKPVFDSPAEAGYIFRSTGTYAPGRANSQFFTFAGSGAGYNNFYQDPSNPNPTFNGATLIRTQRNIPTAYGSPGLGEWAMLMPFTTTQIIRRSGFYPDGTPVATGTSSFYSAGFVGQQITDRSIYDYRKNLFSGGSSTQFADWNVYTASLEGTWWDDRVGLEVSYFKQEMDTGGYNALQGSEARTIFIDPNRYLNATTNNAGNGPLVANPNFGKPTMGGLSGGNNLTSDRDAFRATGYLELRADDFMEKNWISKLLGKMTITGLVEQNKAYGEGHYSRDQLDIRTIASVLSGGVINGSTGGVNQADARIGQIFALPVAGSANFLSATSINDLAGANIQGVSFGALRDRPAGGTFTGWDSVNQVFKTFSSQAYTLRDNGHYPASFSSSYSFTEIESQVFVAQHYLWDNSVVLTGTWRSDQQRYGGIGAPQNVPGVPGVENPFDATYLAGPARPLAINADGETTSWSIVVHTPDFLQKYLPKGWDFSIYRSKADNFRPSGSSVNIFNEKIDPLTGATDEKGVMISALDGKVQARLNWYDTGILNQTIDKGGVSNTESILLNLVTQLKNPTNISKGFTATDVQAVMPPQGVIDVNGFVPNYTNATATTNRNSSDNGSQDFTSEGFEFEVAYNPTDHWTMIVSIAKQQTVSSNTYPALKKYVNEFVIPTWVNSTFAKNYNISATSAQTLAELAQSSIVDPVLQAIAEDGNPAKEERQLRWNLNTSYNFGKNSEIIPKWFGNLTVGGGIRWEDKMNIGFEIGLNEFNKYAADRSKPFYAPSQTFVDVFARMDYSLAKDRNFSVQVNVKDLTNHDELIPFVAEPDGSMLYRFLEGRLVVLSATLEF